MNERPQRIEPGPGQESAWDYPRPPRVEPVLAPVEVVLGGVTIVRTTAALRVLETSHPPVYYLPRADFARAVEVSPGASGSYCEFKGLWEYLDVTVGGRTERGAGWHYPTPDAAYAALVGHLGLYAHRMDACVVGGERVERQDGDFYGGWVTSAVVGPFKGGPGTWGW